MKPHTGPWHYTAGDNEAREKARLAGNLRPDPPEEPTLRGEIIAVQTACELARRRANVLVTQIYNIEAMPISMGQRDLALRNLQSLREVLDKVHNSLACIEQLAENVEGRR